MISQDGSGHDLENYLHILSVHLEESSKFYKPPCVESHYYSLQSYRYHTSTLN